MNDMKYIYNYLDRLTKALTEKQDKLKNKLEDTLIKEIEVVKKDLEKEFKNYDKKLEEVSKKEASIDTISLYKILDKVKMYTIKNGNWYFEDKDLGIKAVAKDGINGTNGKDGRNGIDGINGKDGKNGTNGRDGKDGRDGIDGKDGINGRDGKDAIEADIKIGKVNTIQAGEEASVDVRKENNTYILDFNIPRGVSGRGMPGKGVASGGTTNQVLVKNSSEDYDTEWVDRTPETASLLNDRTILKEPTGFIDPQNVIITYNSTTRKITLTGTMTAYYQGVDISIANPTFVSGWTSAAHADTVGNYFLYYDGTNFVWGSSFPDFSYIQIAIVNYRAVAPFANRECHGFMPWQCHKNDHYTIGTYRTSGGDISNLVLASTTADNRRPIISDCTINDEDCVTVNAALTSKKYSQRFISNANDINYTLQANDIVPLSTNRPYYNSFTTPNWGQTLMPANSVMTVWLYEVPTTADTGSQEIRHVFVQGQSITQATN